MDQAEGLRNIVKHQNQKLVSKARVITVTSGKGGVGKSSAAINLALCFRRLGKKVIILDADFGLANIEVMFGVIPQYNLSDIMFRGKELKDIIMQGPEGVGFISGGSGIAKLVNLDNEQIKRLVYKLTELERLADVIIIDTGAGIAPSVLEFVAASAEVILVTTPEPTSITDAYALLKALNMFPGFDKNDTQIKVLCNRVNSTGEGKNLFEKLNMVVSRFLNINLTMLGCVPMDSAVTKAVMKQKPVSIMYPNAPSARAFAEIAKNLDENSDNGHSQKIGVGRFFINVFNRRR
ncbi:MAG: MinD/ParA family protein [Thermoflexaceae bacterium]|nr:MinD/ParA family protein [Thermoflexaceae bacterium]